MKKTDYKNKEEKDLLKILADKRGELSAFHFGASGSRTKDVKLGRKLRREIASVLTSLNAVKIKA